MQPSGLDTRTWIHLLRAGLACGVRKLKLVGGEPLVRPDLPEIIASLRAVDPDVDISVVTSGTVAPQVIQRCFDAGLSRCNVTVHGFRVGDFAGRGGSAKQHTLRADFLEAVLSAGRPTKLNYVYTDASCEADLAAFLTWATARACTVSVLNDLSRRELDHQGVLAAIARVSGAALDRWTDVDPHSLPALRLRLSNGPVIEVKDQRLGEVAPWAPCGTCLRRPLCREGILALRLTHTGELRPCMDREDLGLALVPILVAGGPAATREAWRRWLSDISPHPSIGHATMVSSW